MSPSSTPDRIAAVEHGIAEIRAGRIVILVDDEDRENEGDLAMAADLVTPEAINFMARHGRGLICLSLTEERVEQLALPMMAADNRSPRSTAFTVSVDARAGMTTGISARERSETVRVAVAANARPEDLVTPGHIFPLRARRGGVLVRSGHTEGSVDLARLAGREPAAVICEIMRDDGEMARMPDLAAFAKTHGLPILKIADLIEYRLTQEILVRRAADALVRPRLPGVSKDFRASVYTTDVEDTEYLAFVLGEPRPGEPTLVRVQTASVLRDVFQTSEDPTAATVAASLRMIEEAGRGVLLYVFPRGRASLLTDFEAQVGRPAAAATSSGPVNRLRDFGLGAQVLADLGCGKIRLMTNNPRVVVGVSGYGLDIVECLPIRTAAKVLPLREQG
ncbi:MAG TPA: 3,4-dihydroxy-2-butanone-4-phosphate synthase [Polyangia bacterium]|jgi:3,4-dihydroxy 2-butanone 4-phosphate synthase/GTP cyclohydrolase II